MTVRLALVTDCVALLTDDSNCTQVILLHCSICSYKVPMAQALPHQLLLMPLSGAVLQRTQALQLQLWSLHTCGSASGLASKMISSTPMGAVCFSRIRPAGRQTRQRSCWQRSCMHNLLVGLASLLLADLMELLQLQATQLLCCDCPATARVSHPACLTAHLSH